MNLDELRCLALAATPGEWQLGDCDLNESWEIWATEDGGESMNGVISEWGGPSEADAAFIAAFNPETVGVLLEVARAANRVLWLRDNIGPSSLCPPEDAGDPGGTDRLRDALAKLDNLEGTE